MKKLTLIGILCLCFSFAFSQKEKSNVNVASNPKEQSLDKPINVDEAPKKQTEKTAVVTNSINGLLSAGQTPSASPETGFINRFQEIPVNLYMGVPQINLPIYTLSESGGATVPIMIGYNSSGIKAQDVAS